MLLPLELNLLKGLCLHTEVLSPRSHRPGLGGGVTTGEAGLTQSWESAFHKHLPTGAFGPVDACRCRQVLPAHQDLGSY